ncbi:ATP-dependent RNA helicase HrpA [Burkholderiales bacterium]|nr:ATP-dependent RNA helicase HrpA [Burkholderiales bacterium]
MSITFDDELPISARRDEISRAIASHQVVIVCGETGSGKTTQLPKICLALGRGQKRLIGHTQPRRIAASSVARRIAQELDTPLGQIVGYKVRFSDQTRPGARVKLMTDGILLAETHSDPQLLAYDTIIIDEAHERSLNIDFLLGYLRQLLPRRADLKVIVTSATIDAERFAGHFATGATAAPVLRVSGRLFPVEVRYRPYVDADPTSVRAPAAGASAVERGEEAKSQSQAVLDAVDELVAEGRGDVLVFLPGEREIRDLAEALRKHHPPATEILPLYARLSASDQERVFRPSGARRIVLATNIAETSLTVPGIRFVVDTGQARVKRYSYRNKVEQLHLEAISRAAADQRAGRCGRVAAGICIRLYAEGEWLARPAFTDPEVLRSSLASVILRMSAHGLGDPAQFPFLEAPPPRAIVDGYQLLAELNAVDEQRNLTVIGRDLARLPVDPRIGRILLAAREQQCLHEALIIAAALSVQDPRERPAGMQQAADEAHRRRADERSDFLTFVRLWDELQQRVEHKKSNRRLADELGRDFINLRRVREWRDVQGQLHQIVAEQGWRLNTSPATYEQVHRALLAGLLGNIGMKSGEVDPAERREPPFLGARGIKFHLWPGSVRARRSARWLVAAELVETSRVFARTVADVDPKWIEQAGMHLLKKSYGDPHWEKRAAQVVALERGTLYGLPVYQQRRVPYGPIDPQHARQIFLREALVLGQWETRAAFFLHNRKLVEEIRELEHRTRRPDVLVDEEQIFAFYDRLVPGDVCDGASFEHWWVQAGREQPRSLFLSRDELMRHEASGAATELFPKHASLRGVQLALSYHFEPGSVRDGVTMTVPLFALNQVEAQRCEWLVPGMLKDKVLQLLKSLPQKFRRACVPLPAYAAGFVERCRLAPDAPAPGLVDCLIADLREHAAVVCAAPDFKREAVPVHLYMNFKVVDESGRQLAMGRNLAALRAELAGQVEQSFRQLAAAGAADRAVASEPITDWDFGPLPQIQEIRRAGQVLVGHPALLDHGTHCALEVFDDPEAARHAHRAGLRRLFRLQLRQQVQALEKALSSLAPVQVRAMSVAAMSQLEPLGEQIVTAALDRVCLAEPLPRDRPEFLARKDEARGRLILVAKELARLGEQIVDEAIVASRKLAGLRDTGAREDIEQQLARLLGRSFLVDTPPQSLAQIPRYLRAVALRLEKLQADPTRDQARAREMASLQARWLRKLAARKGVSDARLEEFRWLLEELRVSLFAQELRTPFPVSAKRLEKVWASLQR